MHVLKSVSSLGVFSLFVSSLMGSGSLIHDMRFFEDPACTKLKSGVIGDDLDHFHSVALRKVAERLLAGEEHPEYVVAEYSAIPSPEQLARELGLHHGFSQLQNITGIYLEAGQHVVLVGETGGHSITLILPDWMRQPPEGIEPTKDPKGWGLKKQVIELREGLNMIEVERSTNAYIGYYDDHTEEVPPITVHFPTGKVNGYFDPSRHNNNDWNELLDNAVSPIMDGIGKSVQVAFPVEMFQLHSRGTGVELIADFDRILAMHYELLGLVKYREVPQNRILARVNYNYYMFRDQDGMAYLGTERVLGMILRPGSVVQGDPNWGFAHEAGHVMQFPQIQWGGMTEVSVNFFTLNAQERLGIPCRLSRQDNFAKARESIVESEPKISYLEDPNVFNRLVPFWQLHLYFTENGHPDFFPDVIEALRLRGSRGTGDSSILNQFQFIEVVCDVTKMDLTDFFDQWGFFRTGNFTIKDYRRYNFSVTPEMVEACKARIAAKGYPKPPVDLTRITSDSRA